MVAFVTNWLIDQGIEPVIAYYEPYSTDPTLSVPAYRLLTRRVKRKETANVDDRETHAIGAWLPELEFTHYWPTHHWQALIEHCDYHLAVSGNCLAGLPFAMSGVPFVIWVASGWHADRTDRAARFGPGRRLFDRVVTRTFVPMFERRVLQRGTVLALSEYTREEVDRTVGMPTTDQVMPMPIDTAKHVPATRSESSARIGFAGRLDDPRKNVELLLRATAIVMKRIPQVRLELMGGELPPEVRKLIDTLGIRDQVTTTPYLPDDQLVQQLQTLDLFVIPSAQEGLCIAALEAMACGCPVVSTRCGGPEEFVIDDQTGYLVDHDPESMSEAITRVLSDTQLRACLGHRARETVVERYTHAAAARTLGRAFERTYPNSVRLCEKHS